MFFLYLLVFLSLLQVYGADSFTDKTFSESIYPLTSYFIFLPSSYNVSQNVFGPIPVFIIFEIPQKAAKNKTETPFSLQGDKTIDKE